MRKLVIPVAAFALSLGATAAMAQSYQSTTVQTSPDQSTQTTTTTTNDNGYITRRTVTHHYGVGPFQAPAGYVYTRYAIGDRVAPTLISDDDLVIDNFDDYNLQPPTHGLRWIRVGNDALLVDRYNGEVVQAAYGLFD